MTRHGLEALVDVDAYFERIGYSGSPEVDVETMFDLHRHHLDAIPYENLDVQLERLVDLDIARIYDKIVNNNRGGWCYEMNGMFGWALGQVGFDVTRMGGAVAREFSGNDDFFGGHLILDVKVDGETWLCDVGFGDGFHEPTRLVEGPFEQRGFVFELLRDGRYWRVRNHAFGGAPSYDFAHEQVDESLLQVTCDWLRSAPESPFTGWLVVQHFVEDGFQIQQGLTAKHVTPGGVTERTVESPDELVERLRSVFGLDVPEVVDLWPRLSAKHAEFLAGRAARETQ